MSRIIAGRARGTQLRTPAGERTRPTTDRVREAFFSALVTWAGGTEAEPEEQLAGLALLDLFAGSGAIGLEAASRGADRVVCVENHRPTVELIRRNIATTKLTGRVQVAPLAAAGYLAGEPEAFDVVWLDPPYALAGEQVDALLERIVAGGWLLDDGLVVVERARRDAPPTWPAVLDDQWTRRYGETQLYFARSGPNDPKGEQ